MGMIERLVEGSLRNRLFVVIGVLFLIALGAWSVLSISIDAFPDVTNIQVEVLSTVPGMSPPEVERFVTYPVEIVMRGLPRLAQVRSISKAGLSVVTIVFEDGVDIYFARQLVLERLIEARERVPAGTEIAMGPVSTAMGEVYQYTLAGNPPAGRGMTEYLTQVRTVQDWILAPLLKSIPGVNEINSFGGYIRQYHVTVDPEKLLAYDLTLGDIGEKLRRNNLNVGGNILERDERQFLVRGIGLLQNVADIGAVALKTEGGVPVLLRDVAAIEPGQAVRQGGAVKDGKGEVVGGVAMMLRGANGRAVVRAIEHRVGEINASGVLPLGLRVEPYYKRSDIINRAVRTVTEALLLGSVLVILVLYAFLRSFRGAFIVVLALPLSVLFTFVTMKIFGLSANLMSLGGLAISIGMIIDATIIQVENVQRHLSEKGAGTHKLGDGPQGHPRGPKAVHLRGAHHRPDLHPDLRAPGDRGQNVPAPGLHSCHRPVRLAPALARGDPGLLRHGPQTSSGTEELYRRGGQKGLPAAPPLESEAQRRDRRGLGRDAGGDGGRDPPAGDGVHAHHGRGRARHGYPVPARDLPR